MQSTLTSQLCFRCEKFTRVEHSSLWGSIRCQCVTSIFVSHTYSHSRMNGPGLTLSVFSIFFPNPYIAFDPSVLICPFFCPLDPWSFSSNIIKLIQWIPQIACDDMAIYFTYNNNCSSQHVYSCLYHNSGTECRQVHHLVLPGQKKHIAEIFVDDTLTILAWWRCSHFGWLDAKATSGQTCVIAAICWSCVCSRRLVLAVRIQKCIL